MEPTYLTTSYAEREQVKALGARWDAQRKRWFVPVGLSLEPFAPWLPALSVPSAGDAAHAPLALSTPQGVSLSNLLSGVSQAVAQAFAEGVWTRVEVVDARLRSGHVYLEVAERTPEGALVAKAVAILWERTAARVLPAFEAATGIRVGPGIKLLVRARPVFKPQFGLSLEVDAIDPDYTLGDLEARKREILQTLRVEGLLEKNRQLADPWDYSAVVVLAPTGAAGLGDFRAEADRLAAFGVCRFTYVESRFQGEGAAAEMVQRLLSVMQTWQHDRALRPDAVVIIRGGGAVNDLAWLNDLALARTVCECPVPVLVGIGHERDHTVLDDVAHSAYDTPSKVIAGIERRIVQRTEEVQAAFQSIAERSLQQVHRARQNASGFQTLVREGALRSLARASAQTEAAFRSIDQSARAAVVQARSRLPLILASVHQQARVSIQQSRQQSQAWMREIAGQGPEKTLLRGFAMLQDAQGRPLTSVEQTASGMPAAVRLRDGLVQVTVQSVDACLPGSSALSDLVVSKPASHPATQ